MPLPCCVQSEYAAALQRYRAATFVDQLSDEELRSAQAAFDEGMALFKRGALQQALLRFDEVRARCHRCCRHGFCLHGCCCGCSELQAVLLLCCLQQCKRADAAAVTAPPPPVRCVRRCR